MLRLILFLIILVVSVWFGLEILQHPGYLLVMYTPWVVQMPLWFAVFAMVLFLGLFCLLINSLDRLEFLWFKIKNWVRIRREHKSYSKTQHGLTCLIEGRWKKAERLLQAGAKQSFEPLMNYLGSAKAAHELGAYERRDGYIQKAYHVAPDADLAIGLTQAELEFEQGRFEHATATLNHLRESAPRHPRVLKMLEKVYVRSADWSNLEALLPKLRKAKIITTDELAVFEKNIYCEIFHAADKKDLNAIHQLWNEVPRNVKKNPDVVCAYVKELLRFDGTSKEVEDLIRKTLKNSWHPELAAIYGSLPFDNLNRQLVIVGAWLKMYGQKPELLLALGKLCVQIQLWGKAKDYFQRCIALGPNAEASLEYGKLLEDLDEPQDAMQVYRDGLAQLAELSSGR